MDQLVRVIVKLISQITGISKEGPDPSQHLWGKDNDKILAVKLKNRYNLQHVGNASMTDKIN